MLQLYYTVETLSVTTSPSQQADIDLYLRMNGAGRRLLRADKVSANEWIEILARHSDDIDLVRHFYSRKYLFLFQTRSATMGEEHEDDDGDDDATAVLADDPAPSSSTTTSTTKVGALACGTNELSSTTLTHSQHKHLNSTNDSIGLAVEYADKPVHA